MTKVSISHTNTVFSFQYVNMSWSPPSHQNPAYLIYGIQNPVSIVPRDNLAITEEGQLAQGPSSGLQKVRLS